MPNPPPVVRGHRLGYARVSTLDQDPALQLDALTAAGVDEVFVDHACGALTGRPQLTELTAGSGPATRWWCGGWTAWAARRRICWRRSPSWGSGGWGLRR